MQARPWAPSQRSWKPGDASIQAQQDAEGFKQNAHCIHSSADALLPPSRTPRAHTHTHTLQKMLYACEDGERKEAHAQVKQETGECTLSPWQATALHTREHAKLTFIIKTRGLASWAQEGQDEKILLNQSAHVYRRNEKPQAHANRKENTCMTQH